MVRIRSEPEDFLVEEIPLYTPEGEGGHTWLLVEKRLVNTEEVARDLARAAGVPASGVGWAGRKDRRAVARQWLSVPGLEPERALSLRLPGARVLSAARHHHRLRLGELVGNRFTLVVRKVTAEAAERARERLGEATRRGMPNRFGSQRYGRHGANSQAGLELISGGRSGMPGRRARLLLSAFQSTLFDEVLRRRPAALDEVLNGDLALVHATGALVPVVEPAAHRSALDAFEQSATGPLIGEKMRLPRGAVRELEEGALADYGLCWAEAAAALRHHGLAGERRPVRVPVTEAEARWASGSVELTFVLPPGSYATVLLEELFGEELEEARDGFE
jgi:tRNA pseudouridine13 synthase